MAEPTAFGIAFGEHQNFLVTAHLQFLDGALNIERSRRYCLHCDNAARAMESLLRRLHSEPVPVG